MIKIQKLRDPKSGNEISLLYFPDESQAEVIAQYQANLPEDQKQAFNPDDYTEEVSVTERDEVGSCLMDSAVNCVKLKLAA